MQHKKAKYKVTGVCTLLVHNGALADPLNTITKKIKKITSKRDKTEADHEEISHLEFLGGLYLDEEERPIIPAEVSEAMLYEAAKKIKKGKLFKAGVFCEVNSLLEYEGPKNPEELWENKKFVERRGSKVHGSRVMRTRPRFPEWSIDIEVDYFEDIVDRETLDDVVKYAGPFVGLGDWRPKFGRFEVEILE